MKKIIIHHRSSHHASFSGYAQLINYLHDVEVVSGQNSILSDRLARIIKNNNSQSCGLYDSNSARKNEVLLRKLFFSKSNSTLIHYLNGERDIRQAINWFQKSKSVATFHKPPSILQKTITDIKYLKKLDGSIAVGNNQVDFLKNWLKTDNVHYIPHGVDTTFFMPDHSRKKVATLLFVGQHLRDFDALNYAIPRLIDKIPNLKIKAVLRKDHAQKIFSHSSVQVYSGVNDEDLRRLYQEATLLFLPLKDVTACNSILEAMSCGLPIVSTNVGGNSEYVKNGSGVLVEPDDYMSLIDATVSLLNNHDLQYVMSKNAQCNSKEFEWIEIANKVNDFYNKLEL